MDPHGLIHKSTTDAVIRAAIEVHRALGPGLLESAYEFCLMDQLVRVERLAVKRQVEVPVIFNGQRLDCGYRIDLLVDGKVIVEVKSVNEIAPIHTAQLITYLRLSRVQVGLLINFNVKMLIDGIVRRVVTSHNSPSALSACSEVNAQ